MKKKLQEKIEAFLATKRKSTGGYAPVTDKDVEQLRGIIQELFETKWERDPDGDLPLEFKLIDRTRFEPMHFEPAPYLGIARTRDLTQAQRQDILDIHMMNLSIAHDRLSNAHKILKYERRQECVCAETSSRNCPIHGQ